jgi:quinol monooxygenase YgiN
MSIRLLVLIDVKPGLRSQQDSAFRHLAPIVRAEPGCLQYDIHGVEGYPERFVILEEWESREALDAHDGSAHMAAADQANRAFRAGPAVVLELSSEPVA